MCYIQAMEQSSPQTAESPPPPAPRERGYDLRTVLVGVGFGAVGALVGRSIGRLGDQEHRAIAVPSLSWGLGLFTGLLAAFSASRQTVEEPPSPASRIATQTVSYAGPTRSALPREHARN